MIAGDRIAVGPGFATVLPDFDFETYSEAGFRFDPILQRWKSLPGFSDQKRGLKAVGVRAYVTHPSFDLLSLYYDLKDGHGPRHWKPGDPDPVELWAYIVTGGLLEAHNTGFEWAVWTYYCVPKLGWPPLDMAQLRCSMAKSRAFGYPGALADVGSVLKIEHQKDPDGDRLLKKFSQPRNPTKGNPQLRLFLCDEPEEAAKLYAYNARDILAEAEVSIRVPDLTPDQLATWQACQRINDRGMAIDVDGVEACIAVFEQAEAKYNHELRALTGCDASDVQAIRRWCADKSVYLDDMTADTLELTVKRLEPGTPVHRALSIRAMLASNSVKKLYSMRARQVDGRVYEMYMYHAAKTGRVVGVDPQPANLYKGEWKDPTQIARAIEVLRTRSLDVVEATFPECSAIDVINNCLRSLFVAGPGKVLVSSDYSAIEGVVTAALAGCEWRLEVFRTHGMIYEASAALICGIPFEEFVAYKKANKVHHPMRNKIGKFAELASGFGGWIQAWKNFGADEFLSDEEIKQAILKWRAASPEIVELWGGQSRGRFQHARPELFGLEGAAIAAVRNPGTAYTYRDIAFQVADDVLYMRLPSGRLLCYHEPRLEPSTRPYATAWELQLSYMGFNSNPLKGGYGWIKMYLYGGLITENAVQATAADIQDASIKRLEAAGYPIVMQTYDEVCAELNAFGLGDFAVTDVERIMMAHDPWAQGWPIKAKGGWREPFYGKFD